VAHLAFVFCCVVWGSTFILLERVTHVFGPVEIAVLRMFSGAAAVSVFWWLRNRSFRLAGRDWIPLLVVAFVFTAPSQVFQAYVLAHGFNHSFLGSMVAAIPLLTILISVPMLGEKPTSRELIGVLGGLACMFLLVEDGVERGMSAGLLALVFTVPLSATLSNTYIKWKLSHVPAAPLTVALLVAAAVSLLPLQLFPAVLEKLQIAAPAGASVTPISVFYLFLIGVVGSGISTMVFVWMVLERGPLFAGMTTYIVPLLALVWGGYDQETISARQLAAIAAILAMVAVVQSGSRRSFDEAQADVRDSPGELLAPAVPLMVLSVDPELTATPAPSEIPESLAS
jgi:drug/metabolite transporter (DMT)-like permease